MGYSPLGCKGSGTTEWPSTHTCKRTYPTSHSHRAQRLHTGTSLPPLESSHPSRVLAPHSWLSHHTLRCPVSPPHPAPSLTPGPTRRRSPTPTCCLMWTPVSFSSISIALGLTSSGRGRGKVCGRGNKTCS